ncbi:dihydroxyacetone kinase-like protein [Arthrobacter sp. V4I6]|uniref:dihydroxyacetone kinase subunit DhaL n=1 Tax=unclassified Arthrobacter TaxID=235627 RepID=UPI0027813144|nr:MULTISPECIES: dihydroxyacetone kinase subunit DhaL [unclassified Arthrobacter]MDQ0821407.1 dihydroxyacetone kinase-like protein [Arthrobacter sp. V1I7]MDQ0855672.1 dihydroxyacetone kinase-like protein [Arthrobacter sp. V4I6]
MTAQSFIDTEFIVRTIAETAVDKEQEFCDLDAVVGDGDMGYSLARGFEMVLSGWDTFDRSDAGAFLRSVAMVISARIGGTSGPIWGTAFLRAAAVAKGKQELTGADAVAMLRAGIDGIKTRGGADVGDKTLLDVLVPVADALQQATADGTDSATAVEIAAKTARAAAEATSALTARRGRASYSGERSIGSPDAGAMVIAIILERANVRWLDR